ncbi:MAG: hypothetical protein V1796_00215 [Pseudomonadota bacterium]
MSLGMEPYHNPRLRQVSMEPALMARGTVPIEGKGEIHTFLPMPANSSIHSVKEAEK